MIISKRIAVCVAVLTSLLFASCTKEVDDITTESLIRDYNIAGEYPVTITPKMLGLKAMAQGPYTASLDVDSVGLLRFHFSGFNAPMYNNDGTLSDSINMPFDMTVDFHMTGSKEGKTIKFTASSGLFKALPHSASAISMDDLPAGISISEDMLGGIEADYATAEGTYNIDDHTISFSVSPNVLPVTIEIISRDDN